MNGRSAKRHPGLRMDGQLSGWTALCVAAFLGVGLRGAPAADAGDVQGKAHVERVILFRHGEKPVPEAFGQLSCKGLNRALALPKALSRYGAPTALFAPDPAVPFFPDVSSPRIADQGRYSYVRPLATIEPLAVVSPTTAGGHPLPVDTRFTYDEGDDVATAIMRPELSDARVFVAWEHVNLVTIAQDIVRRGWTTSGRVPDAWDDDDYDSIYAITVTREPDGAVATRFERSCEGLGDGGSACPLPPGASELSSDCPGPAR